MKKTMIGIWGAGVVGSATGHIFEVHCPDDVEVIYYDKFLPEYKSSGNKLALLNYSKFIFVCLPTPMKITGEISMEYIENSLREITDFYNGRTLPYPAIIIRSTSVSGCTDNFAEMYPKFRFAFMPEFLTEKNAMLDTLATNRVVIGANNTTTYEEIKHLFELAYKGTVTYIYLSRKEAETLKYMSNIQLAAQVLVSNELYFICEKLGVNYDKVRKILALDDRIGKFTQVPGHDGDYGVGGKCFPKDMNAFVYLAKQIGYFPTILDAMIKVNEHIRIKKDWLDIPGAHENCSFEEKKNE